MVTPVRFYTVGCLTTRPDDVWRSRVDNSPVTSVMTAIP